MIIFTVFGEDDADSGSLVLSHFSRSIMDDAGGTRDEIAHQNLFLRILPKNFRFFDNTNRAIQGNVAMQVTQPGGQVCNLCKWRHLMANIRTNASDLVETKMM